MATEDRYETIRAVSDEVLMETRWDAKRGFRRSHLSQLLDIANGTGRRISAICRLTYADLKLDEGPHGAIRWPADTDKMGFEGVVPITPMVRAALDRALRERPGIGRAPLFPSPDDVSKPVSKYMAEKWLRKAEKVAGIPTQEGPFLPGSRPRHRKLLSHIMNDLVEAAGIEPATFCLQSRRSPN